MLKYFQKFLNSLHEQMAKPQAYLYLLTQVRRLPVVVEAGTAPPMTTLPWSVWTILSWRLANKLLAR